MVQGARFAPDGQTFVFSLMGDDGTSRLLEGRTDGLGARPLGLPAGTQILSISKLGEMALLFRKPGETEGTLALAPLSGGAPKELMEHVFAADWGPDGKELAVLRTGERGNYVLEFPAGHRIYDGPPTSPTIIDYPRVSPKGDRVAFLEHQGIGRETLSVVDRQGRRKILVDGACDSLQWAPDGRKLFFTFHHEDDRKELRSVTLTGRQRVLDTVLGRLHIHDISRNGRLLVDQQVERISTYFQGPGDQGDRDLSWLRTSDLADLSTDGSRVLFGEREEGSGPGGAYLRSTDGADAIRLGDGDPLSLSPDGKWALAVTTDTAKALTLCPTGAGSPRFLCRDVRADWALFVAGGQKVLLGGTGPDGVFRGYLQDLAGGPARIWPGRVQAEAYCAVSPDGAQVALGPMNGRVVVSTLDGRQLKEVGNLAEGEAVAQWHASGGALFVVDLTALPAKVELLDLTTGRRKPWRTFGPSDRSGVERIKDFAITPDGRFFAYSFVRILASDLYVTDPIN